MTKITVVFAQQQKLLEVALKAERKGPIYDLRYIAFALRQTWACPT